MAIDAATVRRVAKLARIAEPESRLEQLAARYEAVALAKKEAEAALKEITDAIKAELTTLHPGAREIFLSSSFLTRPLQLQAIDSWRIDSKALKKAEPQTWVRFAGQSTSWRLQQLAG